MSLDEKPAAAVQTTTTTSLCVISFRYIKELKTLADEIRLNALPQLSLRICGINLDF